MMAKYTLRSLERYAMKSLLILFTFLALSFIGHGHGRRNSRRC